MQRQLPGLRLPDSAREVPPGPPSRPAASCSPVSAPDSQPPRGGGRLRPGDAHLCEGSPSSRLSHPPSLPGNFRTSGHELAVRGSGPRGGEGQGCILSPCLFNLYAEYIMRNAGLKETQAGIKIARRNINNLRYADDTTLMAPCPSPTPGVHSDSRPSSQ